MNNYNYKEESSKLKTQRNFGFNFIESPEIDELEKELNVFCNNTLKLYQQRINEVLDKVEEKKDKIKNENYLLFYYRSYLIERIERRKLLVSLDSDYFCDPEIKKIEVIQQILKKHNLL